MWRLYRDDLLTTTNYWTQEPPHIMAGFWTLGVVTCEQGMTHQPAWPLTNRWPRQKPSTLGLALMQPLRLCQLGHPARACDLMSVQLSRTEL